MKSKSTITKMNLVKNSSNISLRLATAISNLGLCKKISDFMI